MITRLDTTIMVAVVEGVGLMVATVVVGAEEGGEVEVVVVVVDLGKVRPEGEGEEATQEV